MSKFELFDVHTHIQFAAFEKDYKEVIDRALKQGVALVNVGTQKDTSLRAIEIAEQYADGVYAAVGLHPIHTENSFHDSKELGADFSASGFKSRAPAFAPSSVKDREGYGKALAGKEDFDYEYYKKLAKHPKTVAIGECGLDYYRKSKIKNQKLKLQFKIQKETFIFHIDLAAEVKKPLMIHCRAAFDDLLAVLNSKSYILNSPPGIIHFFSGSKKHARELLDLGFSFSFGGVITFARDYDEVIKYLPMENIVLETDAPYVAPIPYRGKRNEPSYVIETAKKIAAIKNISFEEVVAITTKNAFRIFNLS